MSGSANAAKILRDMLTREPDLWRKERRCRALLADELPDFPAEHIALRRAMSSGVPEAIANRGSDEPLATLLARLGATLQSTEAMSADLARWSVSAWASAMGVTDSPMAKPSNSEQALNATRTAATSWTFAVIAAPFLLLALLWLIRIAKGPQSELDAMWRTATHDQVRFLAWYLPPAITIAVLTWLIRSIRRSR